MSETAELDSLMIEAKGIDGDLAAQAPKAIAEAQEQAAAVTLAESNSQGVKMVLAVSLPVLGKLYPSLVDVYTPEACEAVAASLGPVLADYGVDLQQWGGRYQHEIAAAIVCGPIAWATVQAIKTDIAARVKAAKVVAAPEPQPQLPKAPAKSLKPGDMGYVEAMERGEVVGT
jgi:hypothetical protein